MPLNANRKLQKHAHVFIFFPLRVWMLQLFTPLPRLVLQAAVTFSLEMGQLETEFSGLACHASRVGTWIVLQHDLLRNIPKLRSFGGLACRLGSSMLHSRARAR